MLQISPTIGAESSIPAAITTQSFTGDLQLDSPQLIQLQETSIWSGFKLVGDNIDKTFRRCFQCHDKNTISLHAFHFYAVKDHVDLSSFSDIKPDPATVDVAKLLVSKADVNQLNKELTMLLSR